MQKGSSEQVRAVASEKYVQPALRAGRTHFSVAVRDVIRDLVSQGFPPTNTPQVCSALRKKEFLQKHGIEIEAIDGPRSKSSSTVVYRYRLARHRPGIPVDHPDVHREDNREIEDPELWANRVTEKIRGILKNEIAGFGGTEAFIRWVRSEDGETE